jgi:hypothetical protein
MAHPGHEEVRQRYHRRCGYCGVSETEAGGELTVDHFRPVSAGGDDREENLVYACFRCNLYKGDFYPDAVDIQHGRRILHPLLDPVSLHVRANEQTGHLEALTPAGSFYIFLLRLNRPQLVERHLAQRLRQLLSEAFQLLQNENSDLRVRVLLLEGYLGELNRRRAAEAGPREEEPPP